MAKQKRMYMDDKQVTSLILRDMDANKGKDKKVVSEELAIAFMTIQEKILNKPNFKNYYGMVKDLMRSSGTYLFLTNWYKFKPYRVKNNFKKVETGNFILEKGLQKDNKLIMNRCFKEYEMLEIHNRTYSVKECKKLEDNRFLITFYNKLKCDINPGDNVIYYVPKVNLFDWQGGKISGGFTLLSTFAFTGARNEITARKVEKEKQEKYLNDYSYIKYQNISEEGILF